MVRGKGARVYLASGTNLMDTLFTQWRWLVGVGKPCREGDIVSE